MVIKAYIYHKRSEKYSDCQDCFGVNLQNNRIAVSDGMSQSIFPQWWSKILVDYYLENGHIPEDIRPLQEKWQHMLHNEILKREEEAKTNPKRDPWRLKNLLAEKSGAGATLCGLTMAGDDWTCECIGDSCLIVIGYDYTLNFYTSQVGEFGNHPDYLDSFSNGRGQPVRKAVKHNAKALLMVSDPFAELFQINENNPDFVKSRLDEIVALAGHDSFVELVEKWRDDFGMHNDDSTLVLIQDLDNLDFYIEYSDDLAELCSNERKLEEKQAKTMILPQNASSKIIGDINISKPTEPKSQVDTFEDAVNQFVCACESLLIFYAGKKKEKTVEKWIVKFLMQTIKKYIKK